MGDGESKGPGTGDGRLDGRGGRENAETARLTVIVQHDNRKTENEGNEMNSSQPRFCCVR